MSPDASTPRVPRAEVRQRLLQAAAQLFAERGIHETRIDDLAAAAGFSKGAVYSNFTSKDDLVAQVMRDTATTVIDAVRATVGPETAASDLPTVTRAAFVPYTTAARVDEFDLLSEFRLYAKRHPGVLPDFLRHRDALQDGMRSVVEDWYRAHPELDTGLPAATLARVLVATNIGIAFDAAAAPGVAAEDVLADLMAALVRT